MSSVKQNLKIYEDTEFKEVKNILGDLIKLQTRALKSVVLEEQKQFPDQGLNTCPLHWKCGVLTNVPLWYFPVDHQGSPKR